MYVVLPLASPSFVTLAFSSTVPTLFAAVSSATIFCSATVLLIIELSSSSTPSAATAPFPSFITVREFPSYDTLLPAATLAFNAAKSVTVLPAASAIVLPAALNVMVYFVPSISTSAFLPAASTAAFALSSNASASAFVEPIVYSFPAIVTLSLALSVSIVNVAFLAPSVNVPLIPASCPFMYTFFVELLSPFNR